MGFKPMRLMGLASSFDERVRKRIKRELQIL